MKNRLVGLDQNHLDILFVCSTQMYVTSDEFKSLIGRHGHTWLKDYLRDLVNRDFLTISPSGEIYALTSEGRTLWNLSKNYDENFRPYVDRSVEFGEDDRKGISPITVSGPTETSDL